MKSTLKPLRLQGASSLQKVMRLSGNMELNQIALRPRAYSGSSFGDCRSLSMPRSFSSLA